jgi:hypothetical protein
MQHICIYVHMYIYVHIYVYIKFILFICIYVYIYTYMYIYMCVCIYICVYIYIYIYIYIYMCVCVCVCVCVFWSSQPPMLPHVLPDQHTYQPQSPQPSRPPTSRSLFIGCRVQSVQCIGAEPSTGAWAFLCKTGGNCWLIDYCHQMPFEVKLT